MTKSIPVLESDLTLDEWFAECERRGFPPDAVIEGDGLVMVVFRGIVFLAPTATEAIRQQLRAEYDDYMAGKVIEAINRDQEKDLHLPFQA